MLDLGWSPLADRFPRTAADDEPCYPLRMAVCGDCWLAQLLDVVDDGELFGADYGFLTGGSPAAVGYFARFAKWAVRQHGERARRLTVEIACNDGTLLGFFRQAGCPTLGVEPAAPAAKMARGAGLDVVPRPFTEYLGREIRERHGPAGLVVACNVVAHVTDPVDFLRGVRALLAPDGAAVFEFQYVGDLVGACQFDHVYHEHRYFYSLASFTALAERAGLAVTAWERTPAQGGSLRVTAVPGERAAAVPPPLDEIWLRMPGVYDTLQPRAEAIRGRLWDLLAPCLGDPARPVAGYGATAKSATLLNFCGINWEHLAFVADATPSKAGRLTPGTHIPVVAEGGRPDPAIYLLLAWNYLGSVLRREQAYLARGGRFIVPFPFPVEI